MIDAVVGRLRRLVVISREYEYRYDVANHSPKMALEPGDPDFFLLTDPSQVEKLSWESGEKEANQVRRLLGEGEVVAVLHRDSVVHARLALRTKGWVSTAAQRRYRPLEPEEGYFHFMRTALFARGNGYQLKIHAPYYETSIVKRLTGLTSTCHVSNVASIKGIERSGGTRVKEMISVGFLGGRFGFSLPVSSERPDRK